jgi:S1-C subfamily serine protease
VRPDSAAEKAGLKGGTVTSEVGGNRVQLGGDLIVSVNGVSATEPAKVGQVLRALKPGELIHYELLRGGRPTSLDIPVPTGFAVPALKK